MQAVNRQKRGCIIHRLRNLSRQRAKEADLQLNTSASKTQLLYPKYPLPPTEASSHKHAFTILIIHMRMCLVLIPRYAVSQSSYRPWAHAGNGRARWNRVLRPVPVGPRPWPIEGRESAIEGGGGVLCTSGPADVARLPDIV